MCGIFGCITKEPIWFDKLDVLFKGAVKRGNSGTGLSVYIIEKLNNKNSLVDEFHFKYFKSWNNNNTRLKLKEFYNKFIYMNDIYGKECIYITLGQQRQRPETEIESNEQNIIKSTQPVINNKYKFALVHNGAISNHIGNKYNDYAHSSKLDSEVIGLSYYNHNGDLLKVCTELVGGFASILFDFEKPYFDKEQISNEFVGHPLLENEEPSRGDFNQIFAKKKALISIFAGRIADTGIDPDKIMTDSVNLCKSKDKIK
jgi:hypothetical protein